MKAVLIFNLNNQDDKLRYKIANKADSMALSLWEFSQSTLRKIRKYEELTKEEEDMINRVEREFYETLVQYGVDLDELS